MLLCYGSADGVGTSFLSRKVSGASCSAIANISDCYAKMVLSEREVVKSIGTPRVLDLEPQILETVEENPSTSTAQF
jgi:hypothetical protein